MCSELLHSPKSLFGYFWAFCTSLWSLLTQTILWFCYSTILWFYDQSLRKETEIFWYFPSSCHLDVSQLSFLLFCAFILCLFSLLSLVVFLSSSCFLSHQLEILRAVCEIVGFCTTLSLYQIKYNHTNNFKLNKFSIYEVAKFLVWAVTLTVFTSRKKRTKNILGKTLSPSLLVLAPQLSSPLLCSP